MAGQRIERTEGDIFSVIQELERRRADEQQPAPEASEAPQVEPEVLLSELREKKALLDHLGGYTSVEDMQQKLTDAIVDLEEIIGLTSG